MPPISRTQPRAAAAMDRGAGLALETGRAILALRSRPAPVRPGPGRGGDAPWALPILPESPTAAQAGQVLYYYHCMPCHGDRGQGLTDEWRQVWVEDHQNCWGRGCHAGRLGDEGFPLPRVIPGVIGGAQGLNEFSRATALEA